MRIYKRLEELATTDDLTGIDNRRQFFDLGIREFNRAQRYQRSLTSILIDLDHFKKINDLHGHLPGDIVLKQVAQTCHSEVRGVDVLGRYGGEEFALLLYVYPQAPLPLWRWRVNPTRRETTIAT
ncbi:MAG: GGDEF domain-containing protein [Anaerolineaceae bacterium]|nr:GGDEF domain-containing protein [Anaerolineaceae bacterium]